jgi:hypothetical protein
MTEAKRIPLPPPESLPDLSREHTMDAPQRPATVVAFGLVALVSMIFGFVVGLFF